MSLPDGAEALLKCVPVDDFETLLDLGAGTGEATEHFLACGKTVIATGYNESSFAKYRTGSGWAGRAAVSLLACDGERLPLADGSLDAVWASHVLEHTRNPGAFLDEIHRVLRPAGWLFVLVPPSTPRVVGGHLSVGWNVAQLLYVLVNASFRVRDGHFVQYGYNVAAFVRRAERGGLPPLMYAAEDLLALRDRDLLPPSLVIRESPRGVPYVDGTIDSIHWPPPWASGTDAVPPSGCRSLAGRLRRRLRRRPGR